jgi:hypothetical protein
MGFGAAHEIIKFRSIDKYHIYDIKEDQSYYYAT